MSIGRSCVLSDSMGCGRRASSFAALGHHIVSEHQQHLTNHASAHDDRPSISTGRMSVGASDMVTVRRAWQGQHRGSNAARRYLHNCTEARIARISGSMRSQMRALSLAPTLVVRAIVTCSHCQVASSPQEVQERLVPTRCDSKVRRDHSHSAVALLLRNSAIPGKSYGEEYPSWEKQPGS